MLDWIFGVLLEDQCSARVYHGNLDKGPGPINGRHLKRQPHHQQVLKLFSEASIHDIGVGNV